MHTVPRDPLTFDAATHTYTLDGVRVPSVTDILRLAGFLDFSRIPADILDAAQERGTLVHEALHYLADDDLHPDSVPDAIRGYVEAGIAFRRTAGFSVVAAELRVFSRTWQLAGTVDLVGYWDGEDACLADYKTGDPADVAADLQLAAYVELLKEMRPDLGIVKRVSVRLTKDGAFHVEPYDDDHTEDWEVFRAALTTVTERRRRQKRTW
jgi:hypothetical protein